MSLNIYWIKNKKTKYIAITNIIPERKKKKERLKDLKSFRQQRDVCNPYGSWSIRITTDRRRNLFFFFFFFSFPFLHITVESKAMEFPIIVHRSTKTQYTPRALSFSRSDCFTSFCNTFLVLAITADVKRWLNYYTVKKSIRNRWKQRVMPTALERTFECVAFHGKRQPKPVLQQLRLMHRLIEDETSRTDKNPARNNWLPNMVYRCPFCQSVWFFVCLFVYK